MADFLSFLAAAKTFHFFYLSLIPFHMTPIRKKSKPTIWNDKLKKRPMNEETRPSFGLTIHLG
uniref:Uncharacterized protein n=1 Tax=Cucumis melo TaxID=3656 RepID=A0A9I9EF75_CUCME